MEQYLLLTRGNQAPGVVKPEIGGNVKFEIKSQLMRELREDTFSGNKNDDAHEHVERPLSDGWTEFHQEPSIPGIFLKRPLSKGIAHRSKPLSRLKKSETSSKKGLIPGMTHAQALTAIQTMADHSQKWHDGSSSRNVDNSSNPKGISAIVSKLDSLGQDMKKLKENVHAILRRSSFGQRMSFERRRRADDRKFEECRAIYAVDESPLYIPFYYSPEEIEYFCANSGFSNIEEPKIDQSGMAEALTVLEATRECKKIV
ncbi:hypothetical protein Tco_0960511 [Tanacetum coccineum]